jgi:hypothetical protein
MWCCVCGCGVVAVGLAFVWCVDVCMIVCVWMCLSMDVCV